MNIETYYRCGYQISGAELVTTEEYERTEKGAQVKAAKAAEKVYEDLQALGLANEVSIWTQQYKITHSTETEPRDVFLTIGGAA